jgi:hypothetical protein
MTSKRAESADQTSFCTMETPERCTACQWLPGAPAGCYGLRRSGVHLGNISYVGAGMVTVHHACVT